MKFQRNIFRLKYKNKLTEQAFRREYYTQSIKYIRIGLTICFLAYLPTAIIDYLFFPKNFILIWIIRIGIGNLFLMIPVLLSYTSFFKRSPQFLQSLAAYGIIISLVIAMYIGGEKAFHLYSPIALAIILFIYCIAQLFTAWAAATSIINSLIILFSVIFLLKLPSDQIIHTMIIFSIAHPVGGFIAYKLEYYSRLKFENKRKLKTEKNMLKEMNLSLESRVKERTKELDKEIILKKRSLKKIKKLNKMKVKFVRILTHQLRTPLTAIRWALESLNKENNKVNPSEKKYFMQSAIDAVSKAVYRSNDMFAAMDIGEKKLNMDIVTADLNSIITKAINELQKKNDKNIKININIPKKSILIKADPEKIENVIIKILDNAIKYSEEKKEITLKIINIKNKIKIEIKDHGIGIPKKDHKMVFSSFFRGSNANYIHTDGTGVSLALAQYYIKRHNGKIGFISEENKGSTFWIELPKKTAI